ncbi:MAG: hypothetical protein RJB47_1120 [Pseudomonadota bacterium]
MQSVVFKAVTHTTSKLAALTAAASVTACGGGGDMSSDGPGSENGQNSVLGQPALTVTEAAASRFLGHAAWGGNPSAMDEVIGWGMEGWLDAQLALPIKETFVEWLVRRGYGKKGNSSSQGLYPGLWRRLMSNLDPDPQFSNNDAVRQRMALALSEFFVCSFDKLITGGYGQFAMAYYWDILEKHAFGNFRALLEEVTLNPAMGFFLNTRGNTKATPGRVPDQNYAREVMQLFSIGLHDLNPDGTEKKDAQGQPIETYTNEDIEGLSKVFTGWNTDGSFKTADDAAFWSYGQTMANPMVLNESLHSPEEKKFLDTVIPAGTNGKDSLKIALDALFNHANTGPFFAKQMIQRLVTSNPSPAYVQRVAQVFANNGQGTRGDLKAVFKALLLDPEARQFDQGGSSNSFGKLREPMVRLIQWARTFSATSVSVEKDKEWEIYNPFIHFESELGQKPMFAPSVFNFFRPGYTPPNSGISQQGLLAPEFQILTEPAIVGYVNFMQKMVSNHEAIAKPPGYLVADYSAYVAMAIDPTLLLNKLTVCLAPHAFNASQINTMAVMLAGMPDDPAGLKKRVYTAVWLIMCVPDYLIQR